MSVLDGGERRLRSWERVEWIVGSRLSFNMHVFWLHVLLESTMETWEVESSPQATWLESEDGRTRRVGRIDASTVLQTCLCSP